MRSLLRTSALRSAAKASRGLPAYYATARPFSVKAAAASTASQRPLDPSKLHITKTKDPKTLSKPEDLVFGKEFTGKPD
jgi:branched-chain amino acid aminotransferase